MAGFLEERNINFRLFNIITLWIFILNSGLLETDPQCFICLSSRGIDYLHKLYLYLNTQHIKKQKLR